MLIYSVPEWPSMVFLCAFIQFLSHLLPRTIDNICNKLVSPEILSDICKEREKEKQRERNRDKDRMKSRGGFCECSHHFT